MAAGQMRRVRTHIGPYASEGARQLWLQLRLRNWTEAQLADAMLGPRGCSHYWLYGDRRPGLPAAVMLRDLFGIDPALWLQAPLSDMQDVIGARVQR